MRPNWAIRIRVGVGVAAVCLAGPTVQAASAEDGLPLPVSPEHVAAAVDGVVESALATVPALPATAPVALESTTSPDSGAPVVPPPDAAAEPEPSPQPAPAPAAAPSEVPAPVEPVAPQPDPMPAAAQAQPANVNVSVRIDSPGDNGAVTQVNTVAVTAEAPTASASAEQYQPAPPQYQPAQAAPDAPAAASTPPAAAAAEPGWSWTWTCGDSVTHVLPAEGADEMLPTNWSWNWTWNCGEIQRDVGNSVAQSGGQYQPGVAQYHPVNINISIRINSPGNDGPVTQTNVTNVTFVVVAPPVLATPALPVSFPAVVSSAAESAGAELAPELAALELTMAVEGAEAATDWIFRGVTGPVVDSIVPAQADAMRPQPASTASPRTYMTPKASAWTVRAVAVTRAQASVRPDRPARTGSPRKPSRRPLPPTRAPVLASGFAGTVPGGADGGGWPLLALLLVPFSLALVDSASRTVRVATQPAAVELRSRRERPG